MTPTPLSVSQTFRATACSSPTSCARAAPTRPRVHIYSLARKKPLEDELPSGIYYSIEFTPDGKSLYYARTDRKGTLLYLHAIGTRNADDKLIFGREFHGELLGPIDLFRAQITDDARYLVITIERGIPARRVDICFRDLTKPGLPFEVLVWGLDSRFSTIYTKGAWYVRTDYSSPNGRILRADPGIMPEAWKTIVPEGKDVIETFSIVGGKIYVKRLHDVKSETIVYTLDGKPAGTIDYSGVGSAPVLSAAPSIAMASSASSPTFGRPPFIRIDTLTGKRELFAEPKVPFDTAQYELKQVFYKSSRRHADSHVHRREERPAAGRIGPPADDRLRRLQPQRDAGVEPRLGLVDPAGRILRQFPTCAAAVSTAKAGTNKACSKRSRTSLTTGSPRPTTSSTRSTRRRSTSRSLGAPTAACSWGHPSPSIPRLFSAVWCGYPLLDMLRYQKFRQGPHWTTEYGSAEKEKQFPYL